MIEYKCCRIIPAIIPFAGLMFDGDAFRIPAPEIHNGMLPGFVRIFQRRLLKSSTTSSVDEYNNTITIKHVNIFSIDKNLIFGITIV